jgi:hypothetical protein
LIVFGGTLTKGGFMKHKEGKKKGLKGKVMKHMKDDEKEVKSLMSKDKKLKSEVKKSKGC